MTTKTQTVPARVAFRAAHGPAAMWDAADIEGYLTAGELDRSHGLLDPKPRTENTDSRTEPKEGQR
ncbi:hypothetical protein GXW82_44505 [Streptacidiphilus sp. 4-A2]|nr:hypothetical protein [Streptacidiphilus sp. 4-A2]